MFWWILSIALSAASLIGLSVLGYLRGRRDDTGRPVFHLFCVAAVFVSAFFLILPVQVQRLAGTGTVLHPYRAAFSSVLYTLQMFALDVDYNETMQGLVYPAAWLGTAHTVLMTAVFVAAPLMTLSVVLSFFRNAGARFRCMLKYNRDTYAFSELNERSLVLAESIRERDGKACLIFAGAASGREEETADYLAGRAGKIGAVCFKKDILSVGLGRRNPEKRLNVYVIGDDETENIIRVTELKSQLEGRRKCRIYVFSSRAECEYLFDRKAGDCGAENGREYDADRFAVRRINAVASLVSRTLYDDGWKLLYETAYGGTERKISAVLVGLGRHGMEMLKALAWYCRMDGYGLEINAFDRDPGAGERIAAACPGLFSREQEAGAQPEGGAYDIRIHPDTDTDSARFTDALREIAEPTYVFVALGDDELNIRTAVNLRTLFEQNGRRPKIQAVVYNSREKEILQEVSNFKEERYDIGFIGDVNTSCAESALINTGLETAGLMIHREYSGDNAGPFYDYEYNYRSSCACAVHVRAVAHQLVKTKREISREWMDTAAAWIGLAFLLCGEDKEKAGCTAPAGFPGKEAGSWAEKMKAFVTELAGREPFSLEGWGKYPQSPEELRELNDGRAYRAYEQAGNLLSEFRDVFGDVPEAAGNEAGLSPEEKQVMKMVRTVRKSAPDAAMAASYTLLVARLMKLEHERWCAYMRTEGYRYGEKKNYLGKLHHDLVPYEQLSDREKVKDLHTELLFRQMEEIRKAEREAAAR